VAARVVRTFLVGQTAMLGDITSKKLILLKGFLFLFAGLLASVLLIVQYPSLDVVLLLAVAVWSFARFYYFAFYVIEHYVDPSYRFAGLGSFVRYLLRRRPGPGGGPDGGVGPAT
jgi:hypothetical protein